MPVFASASGLNVVAISASQLISKVVGQTESSLRALFRSVRACAPSLLLIEQLETIAPRREQSDSESTLVQVILF